MKVAVRAIEAAETAVVTAVTAILPAADGVAYVLSRQPVLACWQVASPGDFVGAGAGAETIVNQPDLSCKIRVYRAKTGEKIFLFIDE